MTLTEFVGLTALMVTLTTAIIGAMWRLLENHQHRAEKALRDHTSNEMGELRDMHQEMRAGFSRNDHAHDRLNDRVTTLDHRIDGHGERLSHLEGSHQEERTR